MQFDFIIVQVNMSLNSFCEFGNDGFSSELGTFRSLEGRFCCFKTLIQKITFLPFALAFKAFVTLFRVVGFVMATAFFIATLGRSLKAQEFFSRRATFIAKDLVDWIVFPFIVITGLFRLFLGSTLHPAVYFH